MNTRQLSTCFQLDFFLYIFCRGQFYMLLVKAKENESSTTWEKLEAEISGKRGNPSIKEL